MKHIALYMLLLTTMVVNKTMAQDFYYYKNEKNPLTINEKKILVKFSDQISSNQKKQILLNHPWIKPYNDSLSFKHDNSLVYSELQEGISNYELKNLIKKLSFDPSVTYSNIVYSHADGSTQSPNNIVVVKLKTTTLYSDLENLVTKTKCTISKKDQYHSSVYYISVNKNSTGDALTIANSFYETGLFEFSEPDFVRNMKHFNPVNDIDFFYQWNLQNTGQYGGTPGADINAAAAWAIATPKTTIKIAIIDEGVDLAHPDLTANLLPGYDATGLGGNGNYRSNDAHGTGCAGIAAATGNNSIGIAGIAYTNKIVPVRVAFVDYGFTPNVWITTNTQLADGINWAWQYGGADVLSNSWGGGSPSSLIDQAIHNARVNGRGGLGSSVFFAAGNDNGSLAYPSSNPETIAIGAMSMCNQRKNPSSCDGENWWGSNFGTGLSIVAPGVKIATTDISGSAGYSTDDYFTSFNGTSSATPLAAGVMALMLSVHPCLNSVQARNIIESTASKVGGYTYDIGDGSHPNGTWNPEMGYGKLNAYAAVLTAQNLATNLYLQNQTVTNTQGWNFRSVVGGNNVTSTISPGDYVIASGGNVSIYANSINLQSGFNAVYGSSLLMQATTPQTCTQFVNGRVSSISFDDNYSSTNMANNITEDASASGNNITIYPNPSSGKFRFDLPSSSIVEITIENMLGERVYKSNLTGSQEIDLSTYENGIYIARTTLNGEVKTQKIILNK